LARSREETAQLKQQLAEASGVEKEKRKLQERVEKLEGRVRRRSFLPPYFPSRGEKADALSYALTHRWTT
jgi:hypothetical protein